MLKFSREIRAVKVIIYILKFSVIVRPWGPKQKKQINMVSQFPLLVSSKLNFNILRKVHWLQGLKKLEIHLALHNNNDFIFITILKYIVGLCSLQLSNFSCPGQVITYFFFTWLAEDLPGHLPFGWARMKTYFLCKKIYLFWMTGQQFFQPWVGIFCRGFQGENEKFAEVGASLIFLSCLCANTSLLTGHE